MAGNYLSLSEYKRMLDGALDDFCKALTKRWTEDAVDAMTKLSPAVPCSTEPWAWQWPAESYGHLSGSDDFCGYLTWVMDGMLGHYKDVHCQGWNPQTQKYVECHVEKNLAQIERLAWNRRQEVAKFVPQLEGPDLAKLEAAHNTYLNVAGNLGFHDKNGRVTELLGQGAVVRNVEWLDGATSSDEDWFIEWTGLAAKAFRAGFFASIAPTMLNQSLILASLSSLYSTRAATIQATRLNIVKRLNWATKKLDEKVTLKVFTADAILEKVDRASAIHGIATSLLSAGAKLSKVVNTVNEAGGKVLGPVGAVLDLAGFVGGVIKGLTVEQDAMSLQDILQKLTTSIQDEHNALSGLEDDFGGDVLVLQKAIAGVHSYNLELYDLTANTLPNRTEREKNTGITVKIHFLLRVAQTCFEAAEGYSAQLRILAEADRADRHLAGRDEQTCTGDDSTLEIRDAVEQFMRTSCARFLLAGEQLRKAAEAYAKTDGQLSDDLKKLFADWENATAGRKKIDPNPETVERENPAKEAGSTDRTNLEPRKPSDPNSTNPYEKDRQRQGGGYLVDGQV
ncbi:hypothetical protein [Amycolatopsis sp. BJA-103]|uniref:hypothetical protein n=1 Tax=unclassified Amycolatopsis TaxID=2618356 RepID=UPI000C75C270|nr:hypothetical protein [Amycolatopsis sp. BJA-103]AUI61999.1 hypothetical protein BKN51_30070 [Amycolatopsis sp. BJA-103]PNE20702.1 hypothetical protein B1H26_02365 [Amycolatopsis sp. BJA-103]